MSVLYSGIANFVTLHLRKYTMHILDENDLVNVSGAGAHGRDVGNGSGRVSKGKGGAYGGVNSCGAGILGGLVAGALGGPAGMAAGVVGGMIAGQCDAGSFSKGGNGGGGNNASNNIGGQCTR